VPVLDLSLVTQSLIRLIDASVRDSPGWSPALTLDVTPEPPDRLAGDHVLGLYLYHVSEDPSLRNEGVATSEYPPVRHQPMPLRLHYQLTAHSDLEDEEATYAEQRLFGLALKALHDTPVVTDATLVAGTPVFPPGTDIVDNGNRLRIELQQVTRDEARSAWHGDSTPARLAAYYTVSVVMLEPEPSRRRPGRVLTPAVHVFTSGAPRLVSSSAELTLVRPGGDEVTLAVQPAQAPTGTPVTFAGSALGGGTLAFMVRAPWMQQPVPVDAAWALEFTDTEVTVVLQESTGADDLIPGTHGGTVERTVVRTMPDGSERPFTHRSNEAPFVILPRLDAVSVPAGDGTFAVTGHRFQHPELAPADVAVYVADELLEVGTLPLAAGEFAVTAVDTIAVRLPAGLASGREVPVRVLVNGAESLPAWVTVP
jgi:hypothetical protein